MRFNQHSYSLLILAFIVIALGQLKAQNNDSSKEPSTQKNQNSISDPSIWISPGMSFLGSLIGALVALRIASRNRSHERERMIFDAAVNSGLAAWEKERAEGSTKTAAHYIFAAYDRMKVSANFRVSKGQLT